MAEFAAHLTTAAAEDQPTIFDVLAQENLMTSIRPALKHASRILAESNPGRFGWLYAYNDELYSILDIVLQNHYLRKYGGSFAENFYGMKRIPAMSSNESASNASDTSSAGSFSIGKSLLYLVVWQYCKLKLDNVFESLPQQAADGLIGSKTYFDQLKRLFLTVYPYLHMTWETSVFAYQMAYIFGKVEIHSPLLKLAGVKLRYMDEFDLAHHQGERSVKTLEGISFPQRIPILLRKILGGFAIGLSSSLSVGVFFIQFLDWWYSSDRNATSLTALPVPNSPKKTVHAALPRIPSLCPLCQRKRTNDTVLSTSGFVFCYPCIYKYVRQNHKCPVTSYPTETEHLVKLYLPDG
ncbi:unnamed protein product [Owenia fusiformis]|uniref:Peroxisome assembly protein 12 n=1 Tax=Owenia fusiformis TaxID=6347 RepID=A0A8J1UWT1_OWEFU|nr:unnamed protein product [Owenia fusiformis]